MITHEREPAAQGRESRAPTKEDEPGEVGLLSEAQFAAPAARRGRLVTSSLSHSSLSPEEIKGLADLGPGDAPAQLSVDQWDLIEGQLEPVGLSHCRALHTKARAMQQRAFSTFDKADADNKKECLAQVTVLGKGMEMLIDDDKDIEMLNAGLKTSKSSFGLLRDSVKHGQAVIARIVGSLGAEAVAEWLNDPVSQELVDALAKREKLETLPLSGLLAVSLTDEKSPGGDDTSVMVTRADACRVAVMDTLAATQKLKAGIEMKGSVVNTLGARADQAKAEKIDDARATIMQLYDWSVTMVTEYAGAKTQDRAGNLDGLAKSSAESIARTAMETVLTEVCEGMDSVPYHEGADDEDREALQQMWSAGHALTSSGNISVCAGKLKSQVEAQSGKDAVREIEERRAARRDSFANEAMHLDGDLGARLTVAGTVVETCLMAKHFLHAQDRLNVTPDQIDQQFHKLARKRQENPITGLDYVITGYEGTVAEHLPAEDQESAYQESVKMGTGRKKHESDEPGQRVGDIVWIHPNETRAFFSSYAFAFNARAKATQLIELLEPKAQEIVAKLKKDAKIMRDY